MSGKESTLLKIAPPTASPLQYVYLPQNAGHRQHPRQYIPRCPLHQKPYKEFMLLQERLQTYLTLSF